MPKVSVCIPAYNQPELFRRCLDSVFSQDYKDLEIIVSDDSDSDNIEQITRNISSIKYFRNQKPLGSPENWNNAIRKSNGDFIKLLHHDDFFTYKYSLSEFVKAIETNPKAGMAFCYSKILYKKDNSTWIHRQTPTQVRRLEGDPDFLFFRNVIGSPSAVIHRRSSLLYDRSYQWLVDVEFYMRHLKQNHEFVSIKKDLVTVVAGESRQITEQVTKNKEKVIDENLRLFASLFNLSLNNKKSRQFFAELFDEYGVATFDQLNHDCLIPETLVSYMKMVFEEKNENRVFKKIKKRVLTSRYNKQIFQIERW